MGGGGFTFVFFLFFFVFFSFFFSLPSYFRLLDENR